MGESGHIVKVYQNAIHRWVKVDIMYKWSQMQGNNGWTRWLYCQSGTKYKGSMCEGVQIVNVVLNARLQWVKVVIL